uniref:Uncharacterized protein n=1 Tax=Kalanchoe fedtschenkoi TaxID=63787 RepID=A0A7N0U0G2_KALFE
MGFNSVYRLLREQFQWIDARVLKAVAIEYSSDPNEAFSVVLDEIIPHECWRATPAIPVFPLRNVRTVRITTPSPPLEVAPKHKSVDQKQPVKIASEVPSVPGPSRTQDSFANCGDLTMSKISNHSSKDEDVNENPAGAAIRKSSNFLPNGQKSSAGVSTLKNTTVHQFVGGEASTDPSIDRATLQVPFLSACAVTANKPRENCPEMSRSDQYVSNCVKDLVKDVESDKTHLISAMESVLNTLKVVEAKKQEASRAKAAAAGGLDDLLDRVGSGVKHWTEFKDSNLKLAEDAKKNKSCLTAEAHYIKLHLLHLSKLKDEPLSVLDDMRCTLELQLAQVEDDIKKAKLINLQKEEAQKVLLEAELVKKISEEGQLLKLEAEENPKLLQLFKDYRNEVDVLQEYMKCIYQKITLLKKKFDQHIPIREPANPNKTRVVLDSSISPHESEDSAQSVSYLPLASMAPSLNRSASHSSFSSLESEESTQPESAERLPPLVPSLKRFSLDGSFSSQQSEDSEQSELHESEDSLASSLNGSNNDSPVSDPENEDSLCGPINPLGQSLKRSASYVALSSEDSYDFATAEGCDLEAPAATPKKIAVSTHADPCGAVSSLNTPVSNEAGQDELPNESSPTIPTDDGTANIGEATNAISDAKTVSDDEWDMCGHSDSDAHSDT